MNGKEAHEAILSAHGALRRMVRGIDGILRAELEAPGTASIDLRSKATVLALAVHAHIELEELRALPILRRVDAWGQGRVEEMLADHARHRRAISTLLEVLSRGEGTAAAHAACEFVDDLLAELDHEEKHVLPALLDDGEVIVVRQHAE